MFRLGEVKLGLGVPRRVGKRAPQGIKIRRKASISGSLWGDMVKSTMPEKLAMFQKMTM